MAITVYACTLKTITIVEERIFFGVFLCLCASQETHPARWAWNSSKLILPSCENHSTMLSKLTNETRIIQIMRSLDKVPYSRQTFHPSFGDCAHRRC
jgi:hypothetical protein